MTEDDWTRNTRHGAYLRDYQARPSRRSRPADDIPALDDAPRRRSGTEKPDLRRTRTVARRKH